MICGVALSWRLWISSRRFPLCPVSDFFSALPRPIDQITAALLLVSLAGIIIGRHIRWFLAAFFALALFLLAEDQMRWQPWVYQDSLLLLAIAYAAWREDDSASTAAAIDSCRLIIIATYFWSGVQKLNLTFVRQTWPDMSAGVTRRLPALATLPPQLALIIPVIEIAIAIGLATPTLRKIAVALAIATHAVILATLMASGENTVVWPWNVALMLLLWFLFGRDRDARLFKRYSLLSLPSAMLVLLGCLPALSFAGAWDSYLSGALYSGNLSQAVVYLDPAAIAHLPAEMKPHVWQASPPYFLDINRWAFGELNVPVYPEPRIFRRVAAEVCALVPQDQDGPRLRIFGKPNPLTGARRSEFYDCDHLGGL